MKVFLIALAIFSLGAHPDWHTNFQEAKSLAVKEHRVLLLNFSGSDWCIPCIRMEKQLFETETFVSYANKNLVLVKADFPRLKKNRPSKEQQALNEKLAAVYNPHGRFPLTLLIDGDGKVLKEWTGLPADEPEKFVTDINAAVHALH